MIKVNSTKDKILKAAQKLFSDYDYDHVSIKQICDLSKVSNGSFYHQIGSKENLMKILYIELSEKAIIELLKKTKTKDPIEKIISVINMHIEYALKYGYNFIKQILLLNLKSNDPSREPDVFNDFIEQYVREALKQNIFDSRYEIKHIVLSFVSSINGLVYEWALSKESIDLKAEASIVTHSLLERFKNK